MFFPLWEHGLLHNSDAARKSSGERPWCARQDSDVGSRCHLGGASFPEFLEAAPQAAATQGQNGVGAGDAPVYTDLFEAGADGDLAAGLHDSGARAEVLVVEPGVGRRWRARADPILAG